MEKKKYPARAEHYELYEEIGQGASASVYRATCIPNKEIVAIKVLDFECANSDVNNISREAQTMTLVDHPNVLRSHCSFVNDHNLWVVMPFMPGGSCLHILKSAHPEGFEEVVIATILREALKALVYLHHHGIMHRDVKAGNILICDRGSIKLGDLGVSACLFDCGDRQRLRNTFVGTPCWMAPEVMEHKHGYDLKADIWSFGITALELAHGHAPFSKYPPLKVLLITLQNAPPGLDYERDKKFSKCFKQMIASCLVKDPSKRPSAAKLLKHSFFKQAKSDEFIVRKLLKGMPTLGDRLQALKKKEEDMLFQKKIPDGQKEEMSQNEYKRGISCWNFDFEDLKAQASLIHDEEYIAEKDKLRSSSSSDETVVGESDLPNQLSYMNGISKSAFSSVETVVGESEIPNQLAYMNAVSKAAFSSVETVFDESEDQLSYMNRVLKAASSVETVIDESKDQLSYMNGAAGSSVETVIDECKDQLAYMNEVSKAAFSSVETVFGESEDQLSYMNRVLKAASSVETVIDESKDQLSYMNGAAGSSVETVVDECKDQLAYMNGVSKAAFSSVETVFGESEDQLSYMNRVLKAASSVETVIDESKDQFSYMNRVLKAAGSSVETVIDECKDQLAYMNGVSIVAFSSVETVFGESEDQLSYMNRVLKAASSVETVIDENKDQLSYMNGVLKAAGSSVETVIDECKDQLAYMNGVSIAAFSSVETVFGESEDQLSYMNRVLKAASSVETVIDENKDQLSYMNGVLKAAGSSVETVIDECKDQLSYMNGVSKAAGSSVETVVGESDLPNQLSFVKKVLKAKDVVCR